MHLRRLLCLATVDAIVVTAARPDLSRLAHGLADPSGWVDRVGADRAAATLATAALWVVAVWTALGLLACLAAALPGMCGQVADRLARFVLPAALYRVAAGAAGLGVVLAPVAAGAAPLPPRGSNAAPAPAPAWPSDAPLSAPSWPVTSTPERHAPPASAPVPSGPRTVVVRTGDSLWSIAADHLPAGAGHQRIAQAWPRWYHANRTVIGHDPDLIQPGQVLHVPTSNQEDRP